MLGAAVALAVVPFATRPLFSAAQGAFEGLSAGAFIGSFLGAMLMFALPVTALGAVSPWAVRLSVRDVRSAGEVSGRIYALSTVGAIVGTFLPVLLLIPEIGTRRTLLLIAALLALAAVPLVGWRAAAVPALIACLVALPLGGVKGAPGEEVLFEGESAYQFVQVARRSDGDVVLRLNEGWALHSLTPRQGPLTGGYWDAFATLPLLTGRPDGRLAVLGNAGGTVGNIYAGLWPRTAIDGVEIDPLVSDVGRRYMGMNNPRLSVHTADARFWLQGTASRFDAIVVDAYRQPYIPFHLATREFFQLVRERLRPGGVVAINIGTPPDQTEVVARIAQTMRAECPGGPLIPVRALQQRRDRVHRRDRRRHGGGPARRGDRSGRGARPPPRPDPSGGDRGAGAAHRRPRADRVAHRPGAAGLPARGRPGILRLCGALSTGTGASGAGEAPRSPAEARVPRRARRRRSSSRRWRARSARPRADRSPTAAGS